MPKIHNVATRAMKPNDIAALLLRPWKPLTYFSSVLPSLLLLPMLVLAVGVLGFSFIGKSK
jgi:hypothetical protein